MDRVTTIDTHMHGHPGITGAFLVRGEQTALVETGPKSSVDRVIQALDELGVDAVDWIVVTHIHLDHAGAAGTLAARWPDAKVAVHEVGAPHLIDPSKLWSSATRIYGERMEQLWGGIDPIPEERIRVLRDGDQIDLGDRSLRAVETLGHAGHHHAYLDEDAGLVFAGDALGVLLPGIGTVRPATPPPEFDLEAALASIGRIRDLRPEALYLTHFDNALAASTATGPPAAEDVCDRAADALLKWASWVKEGREQTRDLAEVAELVVARARSDLEGRVSEQDVERMENTTGYVMNTWGYMRYFDKLEKSGQG